MTENSEQFESLKKKLQKRQALAERGHRGEAENARRTIERIRIYEQYGVKLEGVKLEGVLDIETKHRYTFEIGRSKDMMKLFVRCLSSICDISDMTYSKPSRSSIRVELTALQYADVLSLFNWHKANYERELTEFRRTFMSAYIGKHDLYTDRERKGGGDRKLTQEDIERIRRVRKLREAMSDNTYHKQLEASL